MMIQILSFRSRAQIAQLIEETTNTNKNKESSKIFNAAVCLGGMSNIHLDFLKMKEKKLFLPYFFWLNGQRWIWFFEPAEAKLLHGCNLQARKDNLDQLVFISEIFKQDSKLCSKEIQPDLWCNQRIIWFSLFEVAKTSSHFATHVGR